MRVNPRVFPERKAGDMFGGIPVPNCPSQFKVIAERIMTMVTKPGYSVGEYHTMTELDKRLMIDYWQEYDGLLPVLDNKILPFDNVLFKKWFVKTATAPELLRRARQWLAEKHYIILQAEVAERAYEAGGKFSKSVRGSH